MSHGLTGHWTTKTEASTQTAVTDIYREWRYARCLTWQHLMALHRCHGRGTYSANHIDSQLPREAHRRRRQRCQSVVHVKTKSPAPRTMESVRSAFHAQLATVMDSLLAAAVCEIAKIFESSLCEQQAELAQKAEEISTLRGKLEKVERRQKPKGSGSEEGEMSSGDREGILKQQRQTLSGRNQVLNFINTEFHYWTDSGGFTHPFSSHRTECRNGCFFSFRHSGRRSQWEPRWAETGGHGPGWDVSKTWGQDLSCLCMIHKLAVQ